MKFGGGLLSVQNSNAFRQVGVHTAYPCLSRTDGGSIKMNDLGSRMNAGIGSAGNNGGNYFPCYLGKCVFQCRLNGWYAACLPLPTVKAAAVIG